MKKALFILFAVVLGSIQSMALSQKCQRDLVDAAAEAIIQKKLQRPTNLVLKSASAVKYPRSQLIGNVWVDLVAVYVPVKSEAGAYVFVATFEVRNGKCDSAKLTGKITKQAASYENYDNYGTGQLAGD